MNILDPLAGAAIETKDPMRVLLEEKARRVLQEPYRYYEPTGKGEEFMNMVGSGKNFISLLSAANGIGKTTLAVNMLAHLMFPVGSKWFQQPLWKDWPFLKRGRIVSDPTTIKEAIIPELHKWFPKGRYWTEKMQKPYEYRWTTDTGWSFDIMSFDQDPKEFESTTLGWVWLDEPPPESIFIACVSRLRRGGIMFITCTPLTGSAWIYDRIIANKDNETGRRAWMEADVWSASKTKGIRGFLDDFAIENMISQYSEEDQQARVFGKFQHLTGLVFKQFKTDIHVIKPIPITLEDHVVIHALDPHPRTQDAGIWLAIDRQGNKFVCDELWLKAEGTADLAARIKAKNDHYRLIRKLIDPSAFIENQHEEEPEMKSLAAKLARLGINYQPATKFRWQADRRIVDALNYQKRAGEFIKAPELYIFETCPRTIYEFQHYRWQEWKGKAADEHSPKAKTVDKDDHQIENIGRCLLQEARFTEYSRDEGNIKVEEKNLDPFAR